MRRNNKINSQEQLEAYNVEFPHEHHIDCYIREKQGTVKGWRPKQIAGAQNGKTYKLAKKIFFASWQQRIMKAKARECSWFITRNDARAGGEYCRKKTRYKFSEVKTSILSINPQFNKEACKS